ncbi:MAG: LamG-like jellyroll fold domain-containing protein [Chthoniobacteraceae bacterium]
MNEEFEDLAARHFAGQLSGEEKARLAQALDADPEARRFFVRLTEEQTELIGCFAAMRVEAAPTASRTVRKIVRMPQQRSWWPLAIAASVMIAAGIALWPGLFPTREKQVAVNGNPGVARIVAIESADGANARKIGDILPRGVVEISAGKLELLYHSGTRLVLQGRCRVDLSAERACRLLSGRVTVSVPKFDSGFAIDAPGIHVVDIGTEFGLVSAGEGSDLHILLGTVLATADGATRGEYLTERSAVRAAGGAAATLAPIPFAPDAFARPSVPPKPDAPAFVHYSFDEAGGPAVSDHGSGFPDGPFAGTIEGGGTSTLRVPGRFGRALALDGLGMTLTSHCPGIGGDRPRTVAMWVRLPASARNLAAPQCLATWGTPGRDGAQWLVGIARIGRDVVLGTEFTGGRMRGTTSLNDGQWHHVVSVYFGGNAGSPADRIHHYIDGRLDATRHGGEDTINTVIYSTDSAPLTLGRHPYHTESTTQALIDEFYLFDRALTPAEIQSLYRDNQLHEPPARGR